LKQVYLALAWETVLILFLSLFSGPLSKLGIANLFHLNPGDKVARVIFVYHSLATPFICALLFLALYVLEIENNEISKLATWGYILTGVGGIGFSYFSKEWFLHGVFIFGLSLVFFSGILFFFSLLKLFEKAPSLERLLYLMVVLFILISALIGGIVASYFGNGFTAFLSEDVLRVEHNLFQRAIISHLHIMLALIDTFLLLLLISYFKLPDKLRSFLFYLIFIGVVVVTFGTWAVMPFEKIAHKIINFGAFSLLLPAFLFSFWGLKYHFRDAPSFGIFFHLISVNFFVTIPGIYVAINLERIRKLPFALERIFAVGHWHVLSTLTAVIAFLFLVSLVSSGWIRQLVGWGATFGSAIAFTSIIFYFLSLQKDSPSLYFVEFGIFLILLSVVTFLFNERKLFLG
jgi:hypothetical protein